MTDDRPFISTPIAGMYGVRLVGGGIRVPVRIWYGAPIIDGEEQDRSPRWCVEVDGVTTKTDDDGVRVPLDPIYDDIWPLCAGRKVDQAEFDFLTRRRAWAHKFAPDHPAANPRERIDVRKLPPMF